MSSARATVEASPADILCEACGYTLNGLPAAGNCPECGTPVTLSTTESGRILPAWETEGRFWGTSRQVVLQTSQFYRTLRTRVEAANHRMAYSFAMRHWLLAAFLVALASLIHYSLTQPAFIAPTLERRILLSGLWIFFVTGIFLFCGMAVTHLAAWLTAWEAGWRGYRLPRPVVLRGLCYHSAHLLPVSAAMLLVVAVYRLLWAAGLVSYDTLVPYLIILSTAAVAGAGYLFWTYWIGMRNMLYANE